jgi:hypothetical protein
MFDDKRRVTGAEIANGRPTGVSASDQKIIFRRFGSPIEVEIGGEKIMLKPAVFDASDVIHRIVNDARSGVLAESITEQVDAVMKSANIKNKFDAQMLLGAQFIIYNAKFPDWVDRLDGIPPANELEKAITIKQLRKKCTNEDINGLFEVFYQLNQPEVMRQNFLKLGTIL